MSTALPGSGTTVVARSSPASCSAACACISRRSSTRPRISNRFRSLVLIVKVPESSMSASRPDTVGRRTRHFYFAPTSVPPLTPVLLSRSFRKRTAGRRRSGPAPALSASQSRQLVSGGLRRLPGRLPSWRVDRRRHACANVRCRLRPAGHCRKRVCETRQDCRRLFDLQRPALLFSLFRRPWDPGPHAGHGSTIDQHGRGRGVRAPGSLTSSRHRGEDPSFASCDSAFDFTNFWTFRQRCLERSCFEIDFGLDVLKTPKCA